MKPPGRLVAGAAAALLVATTLLVSTLLTTSPLQLLPCLPAVTAPSGAGYEPSGLAALADAAVYYATTRTVQQQSRAEFALSLDVLRRRAPVRLLVFGLGHDSSLWHALNPGGATVFLEEDPEWYRVVRSQSPHLRAHLVRYRTRLDHADLLLGSYKQFPSCVPGGDGACPLALHDLPPEVYENEWDMLMVDAPKGYFPSAPGRMAAIWTAAAMARQARRGGHGRVPARRRPQGGEDVRRGAPLRQVPGRWDRPALALHDPAGVTAGEHDGGRRWREAVLLTDASSVLPETSKSGSKAAL